ncbi:hypothetical protein [Lacticaseibacillus songhuajiangensis]|jgi:hypothetical protein|uniref:hypothetical protein n=1 Tax=Lacticaseibacillus songhuajiangensis TaxID=1296539 RepID=UPI0013DDAA07|nr:hypothetical protein [Lacticaseibacillus songhuajiangensis]
MTATVTTISALLPLIEQQLSPLTISGEAMHTLQKVAIVRNRPYSPLTKLSLGSDSWLATHLRKHFASEPGGRQELEILPVEQAQLSSIAELDETQTAALVQAINKDYQTVLHADHISLTRTEKPAKPGYQKMPSKYEKYLK